MAHSYTICFNTKEPGCNNIKPINYLRPTIHTTRHDDLRYKFGCGRVGPSGVLPCLEQREKRKCEPVRSNCIGVEDIVEVCLRHRFEIPLHKRGCSRLFGSAGCGCRPSDACVIKQGSDVFFAFPNLFGKTDGFRLANSICK